MSGQRAEGHGLGADSDPCGEECLTIESVVRSDCPNKMSR